MEGGGDLGAQGVKNVKVVHTTARYPNRAGCFTSLTGQKTIFYTPDSQ